jgi:hypothetical protein
MLGLVVLQFGYPSVNVHGQVVMSGVPASLDGSVPRLVSELSSVYEVYDSYGITQTSASEYNCDCLGRRPTELVQRNEKISTAAYERAHGKTEAGFDVVAVGYGWSDSYGLVIRAGDASKLVPMAEAGAEPPPAVPAPPFFLGSPPSSAGGAGCECVDCNDCCAIIGQMVPIAGQTLGPRAVDCDVIDPVCVAWGSNPEFAFKGRVSANSTWLPDFDSTSKSGLFCVRPVINDEIPDVDRVRPVINDEILVSSLRTLVFSDLAYSGTCLDPGFFVEGRVFPPSSLTNTNASVTYCLGSFPAVRGLGGSVTFCHNDALTVDERTEFCVNGSQVTISLRMRARTTVSDACDPILKVCTLIAGDTFSSVGDLEGLDLTGYTIELVGIPMGLLSQIPFGEVVFETVAHDLASAPFHESPDFVLPRTGAQLRASVSEYVVKVDGEITGWVYPPGREGVFYGVGIVAGSVISYDAVSIIGPATVNSCGPAYTVSGNHFSAYDLTFANNCSEHALVISGRDARVDIKCVNTAAAVLLSGEMGAASIGASFVYSSDYVGAVGIVAIVTGTGVVGAGSSAVVSAAGWGNSVCSHGVRFACEREPNRVRAPSGAGGSAPSGSAGFLYDVSTCVCGTPSVNADGPLTCGGERARFEEAEEEVYGMISARSCNERSEVASCALATNCLEHYEISGGVAYTCGRAGQFCGPSILCGDSYRVNRTVLTPEGNRTVVFQQWFYSSGFLYASWSGHTNEGCNEGCVFGSSCRGCTAIAETAFVCTDMKGVHECTQPEFDLVDSNLCATDGSGCTEVVVTKVNDVVQVDLMDEGMCLTGTGIIMNGTLVHLGFGYAPCLPCSGGFARSTATFLTSSSVPNGYYGVYVNSTYVAVNLTAPWMCLGLDREIECSGAEGVEAGYAECVRSTVPVVGAHVNLEPITVDGEECTFVGPRVLVISNASISGNVYIENVSEILDTALVYERTIYSVGPSHAGTIWGMVGATSIVAVLGVIACTVSAR